MTCRLQAVCLALLGPRSGLQLGIERLNRMRRFDGESRRDAEILVTVEVDGVTGQLGVVLGEEGPHEHPETDERVADILWTSRSAPLLLAYGASRNLSDYLDSRYVSLSADLRRQMTLFDPLSQVASAEVIIAGAGKEPALLTLLSELLQLVFEDDIAVVVDEGGIRFTLGDAPVGPLDLPDGFRSSVAWLADLCASWLQRARSYMKGTPSPDPTQIRAIVLLDEIDLHLHPTLQRCLVPRLRRALPGVDWIVTTHSPLVISSFSAAEIVVLDRQAAGGVRRVDRQILGFTTDQVYEFLMGTPSSSSALEEELRAGDLPDREVAVLLATSPETTEIEARERVDQRLRMIDRLAKRAGR